MSRGPWSDDSSLGEMSHYFLTGKRPKTVQIKWEDAPGETHVPGGKRERGGGWYLVPRGWMQWACFQPETFTEREAYIWSMEQAAFKAHGQWFNGSLIEVNRGEFVTSHHKMMESLGWSEKKVRNFIRRMIKLGLWAKRGAHKGATAPTIIEVCNYEDFQRPSRVSGEAK